MANRYFGFAGFISAVHGSPNFKKIGQFLLGEVTVFSETSENFISFHIITMCMVADY